MSRLLVALVVSFFCLALMPSPAHAAVSPAPALTIHGVLKPGGSNTITVSNVGKLNTKVHAFGQTISENHPVYGYYHQFITVPRDTKPNSTHKITITRDGKVVSTFYAWVGSFQPQATPSTWYAAAGNETITFAAPHGSFMRGEIVKLYKNGVYTGTSARSGSAGPIFYDFQGTLNGALPYPLKEQDGGKTIHFSLRGQESKRSAEIWVSVAATSGVAK